MASKDLVTRIILKGTTDPTLIKAFNNAKKAVDGNIQNLQKYADTAKRAAKIATGAIAAGATASVKAAIDFESAFTGVKKTVDETDTTTYDDLAKGIRQMSKEMPTAAKDIALVAESAGQLGIKADDILKFSKVMVQLGETTNLSADDAATTIAKLFNVTGTSMDLVDRFGATIVALGNNAATTESDILAMSARIAGSGKQIGLTEQQILALATSLSSVGIEAEMGGSAISTTMTNIDKAVALNTEELKVWAETAGMSASQFKKTWEKDAYGTLQKVIKGMGDTKKAGGNLNVLLEELGITEIRQSDTLKRLASASGLMSDMTNLANKAWEENAALTKEAETRYATMESKLNVTKNLFTDLGITIGEHLMPYVDDMNTKLQSINFDAVAENITSGIDWCIEHIDMIRGSMIAFGATIATIKVTQFGKDIYETYKSLKKLYDVMKDTETVTKLSKAVKKLGSNLSFASIKSKALSGALKIQGIVTGAVSAFKNLGIASKIAAAGQWLLNSALLANPITWVVLAIAGLVAGFVLLWNKCEGFRNFWIGLWNDIVAFCEPIIDNVASFFTETLPDAIDNAVQWFKDLPTKISNFIHSIPEKVSKMIDSVVNFFNELPAKAGYALGYALGTVVKWGYGLIKTAIDIGGKFLSGVVDFFVQLPSKIWEFLQFAWQKVSEWGTNLWNKAIEIGLNFSIGIINFFMALPQKIWEFLQSAWNFIVTWGTNLWNKAIEIGSNFVNGVISFIMNLPSNIWTFLTQVLPMVWQWGVDLAAKGLEAAQNLFDTIVDKVGEIPEKMLEIGKWIVDGLWNGIKSGIDWIGDKIGEFCDGVVGGFKDALGINSPSKITTEFGEYLSIGLGNGLVKARSFVAKSVGKVNDTVLNGINKVAPVIQPVVGKVKGVVDKVKNKVKLPKFGKGGTVTTPQQAIVGDNPETIVPHGNTPRNRALLNEAAKGVGATVGGNTTTVNITFAPVINGGNVEENRKMLQEEEEEFERKLDEYFAKKGRLSFE